MKAAANGPTQHRDPPDTQGFRRGVRWQPVRVVGPLKMPTASCPRSNPVLAHSRIEGIHGLLSNRASRYGGQLGITVDQGQSTKGDTCLGQRLGFRICRCSAPLGGWRISFEGKDGPVRLLHDGAPAGDRAVDGPGYVARAIIMLILRNRTIGSKLNALVAVSLLGFAVFGLFAFISFKTLAVNGPIYASITQSKDLFADVLPPPAYAIEADLGVLQMFSSAEAGADRATLLSLVAHAQVLRRAYETRYGFWLRALPEGLLKQLLVESHAPAADFFDSQERDFIPAILSGDLSRASLVARTILQPKYEAHRAANNRLTQAVAEHIAQKERIAARRARLTSALLIAIGTATAAISAYLSVHLGRAITVPLSRIASAVRGAAEGDLDAGQLAAFESRDEVGELAGAFSSMTDKLKKTLEGLRESEAKYRIVADNTYDWEYWLGEDEHFIYCSPSCLRITGHTAQEFLADPRILSSIIHPGDREHWLSHCAEVEGRQETRSGEDIQFRVILPDGTTRWIGHGCQAVLDSNGKYLGVRGTNRDVTERKCAEQALKESEEELREAARRKDEFLALLSHELRNPLAPIRNSLYVLDRVPPGSEQAGRARAVIERQVNHMTRLVADLLDVSRITRGNIPIQRERLDLREVVSRTLEDYRSVFAARGILDVHSEQPARPVWVHGDAVRLGQVLGNLLHNASKFTNESGVVSVALRQEGQTAILQVRDTGMGMDAEMLVRLFQPFAQADRTLDRSSGGLGLGLALVKGLVELHGGQVHARSDGAGKGAVFTVQIPADAEPAPGAVSDPSLMKPCARRVLIIEDNLDAAESLKDVLQLEGHNVAMASTGPEGLDCARTFMPEVVLCDIGLPGMDGYEVARTFRADEKLRDSVLLALTGYASGEDHQKVMAAGFSRHITKPPDLGLLNQILSELPPHHEAA